MKYLKVNGEFPGVSGTVLESSTGDEKHQATLLDVMRELVNLAAPPKKVSLEAIDRLNEAIEVLWGETDHAGYMAFDDKGYDLLAFLLRNTGLATNLFWRNTPGLVRLLKSALDEQPTDVESVPESVKEFLGASA